MREHLRECVSGRGVKSQNVGCGAQRFFCERVLSAGCAINRRSKERVPATDRSAAPSYSKDG